MNEINRKDQVRLKRSRARKEAFYRFTAGCRQLAIINPWKIIFIVGYALIALLAWYYRRMLLFGMSGDFLLYPIFTIVLDYSVALLLLMGLLCLISTIGTIRDAQGIQDRLFQAGFVNYAKEPPLPITKYKLYRNPQITVWEFDSNETPKLEWGKNSSEIGAALLCRVDTVHQSKNGKRILLYTFPMSVSLPEKLYWQDNYLCKDFVLTLGESFTGRETVDLTKVPHILIAGSSGSGKSILLKLLLIECLKMGAEIYISDFKGGVDFSDIWHQKCHMCFDETNLLNLLTRLTDELQRRKALFREAGCANIDMYNQVANGTLKRIIFSCDEIAEVLDKTGLTKEQKGLVSQIESYLSTIARQGRGFGLHLILATQRPSADILNGQIRNNIDCRICGRADNILSQIILDSTAAAEQIPKDAQGRFITNKGTLFQSYLFDEQDELESVSSPTGGVSYRAHQKARESI